MNTPPLRIPPLYPPIHPPVLGGGGATRVISINKKIPKKFFDFKKLKL